MNLRRFCRPLLTALLILACAELAAAHPVPDLPVRGVFATGGDCAIYVEVNPRCFAADPANVPGLTKAIYEALPAARKGDLIRQAEKLIEDSLELYLEPAGR